MIEYRDFEPSTHLPEQRRLFANCFPEGLVNGHAGPEHYSWKFRGFPAPKSAFEFVAMDSDAGMVGYYAALPYRYAIGPREVTAGMVCDVMTHPASRGKGVFTSLGRFALARMRDEGVAFVTGYPIRPEVIPGHLKVGWRVAFDLPLFVKVLRVDSALGKLHLGPLAPAVNALVALARAWRAPAESADGHAAEWVSVEQFLTLDESHRFLAEERARIGNHLVKDAAFLRWRLGAPGARYRILLGRERGDLVFLAVARKTDYSGIPCLAVLDLMALPGHGEPGLSAAHAALDQEARMVGAELVVVMASEASAARLALRKHGFVKSPRGFRLILNRLDPGLDDESLFREESWNLMWIDSDDL
jgi:GNAT superfamily N-acetyltransferase